MIITKAHQIKELENQTQKLLKTISCKDKIIYLQNEIIEKLENKIKNQCEEIKNLHKKRTRGVI